MAPVQGEPAEAEVLLPPVAEVALLTDSPDLQGRAVAADICLLQEAVAEAA